MGPTSIVMVDRYAWRKERALKNALAVVLIVGFLLVDFLFFHDVLKAGESITFPQYLTGLLSVPVIALSVLFLVRGDESSRILR